MKILRVIVLCLVALIAWSGESANENLANHVPVGTTDACGTGVSGGCGAGQTLCQGALACLDQRRDRGATGRLSLPDNEFATGSNGRSGT